MTTIQVTSWRESEHKAIRQQLARILHSGPFLHSRRLQRFLEYVVNETLAGRSERLKGYHLALEVFDRPATFDPIVEPIVRVEAARLREKLRQYYEADGRGDPIRIDLPKGTYAPQIEFRQTTTRNNDAHDELLRGLKRFWCYTRESCAEAQHHFAQAAILDPEYAAAHAWLARTYHWQACMNWVPNSKSTMDLAIKHARRAVELDDQSSLAHAILGWVQLFLGDVENAVSAGRRACAVDPNSADAKLFLSLILASTGHSAEALRHIETAMLLHPHPSSFYFEALGLCYFALANYDRAIAAFLRGIEINPLFVPCHYELAITYGVCGRPEAAQDAAAIVKADWPNVSLEIFLHPPLAAIYHRGKQVAGLV